MNISKIYKIFEQYPFICTDSRKIINGSIFISLKGKNFNGNKFALKAIQQGCSYAIVDEKKYDQSSKTILVKNCLNTLQKLAIKHREKINIPVIGITGTNGKTTSKELINQVLSTKFHVYATKGNLNNHIGVPLSILEINKEHDIAIIEMGANKQGDIKFLCKISNPNFGIITNVGIAHIEGFKNLQGVVETKCELYQHIKEKNGMLFVNAEDQILLQKSKAINRKTYGKNENINLINSGYFITLNYNNNIIKSNLLGDYQYYNLMLTIAIGTYFKVPIKMIKKSIKNYFPKNNRSQIVKTDNNTIILDAYNANPSSMDATLKSFTKQKFKNKLCILGDMLELGKASFNHHKLVLELTEKLNLPTIFIGKEFKKVVQSSYESNEEFIKKIIKNPIKNKSILLKGSRGISLEKLVEYL